MANIILASWTPPTTNNSGSLSSVSATGRGEVIKNNECDFKLISIQFMLNKTLAPTGNANAVVYNATGTIDSMNVNSFSNTGTTGAALATSDNLDVSTLTTTMQLITLPFSGGNQISLAKGGLYALVLEYLGGDASNFINMAVTSSGSLYIYGFGANISRTTSVSPYSGQDARTDVVFVLTVEDYPKTGNVIIQNIRPSIFSPGRAR